MPNPVCFASLQACFLRVSKLSSSGAPLVGAANGYVTDSIVSLQAAVNVQTGDEFTQKNGCGNIAQYFKQCDRIKSLTLTMNLSQLDANLISFLTAGQLLSSGGTAIGWQYPGVTDACPNGVCVEVWTKAWDSTQQATPAFTTGLAAYWHWVFPSTAWTLGSVQLDNSIMVVPVTATASENTNITSNGPFNDWPGPIAATGGITKVGGVFLDATVPTVSCATIAIPAGS